MKGAALRLGRIHLAVFLVAGLLALPFPAQAQPPLRIAYPEFPPFHWTDGHGHLTGFFHDMIREALEKRMDVPTVWTAYPWTRCQENLKQGLDDAILTVPTAEREEYTVTHRNPLYSKALHVYTYAGHERLPEIRRLREVADIGKGGFSVVTYSGNGWHKEHVESLGVKTFETAYLKNVWIMLANKRGDIVIEWPPGARPDIQAAGVGDQIVDMGITIAAMPFHLLVRKGLPAGSVWTGSTRPSPG